MCRSRSPIASVSAIIGTVGLAEQRTFLETAIAPFVADVRRTLDPTFRVDLKLEDDLWTWNTYQSAGGIAGTSWDPDDAPSDGLAFVTYQIVDSLLDYAFDHVMEPWPVCPLHGEHPLYPEHRHDSAIWVCRKQGGGRVCEIGQFGEPT